MPGTASHIDHSAQGVDHLADCILSSFGDNQPIYYACTDDFVYVVAHEGASPPGVRELQSGIPLRWTRVGVMKPKVLPAIGGRIAVEVTQSSIVAEAIARHFQADADQMNWYAQSEELSGLPALRTSLAA